MKFSLPNRTGWTAIRLFALLLFPFVSFGQPGNDICASATLLQPAITCSNLTGQTLKNATATTGLPASSLPCGAIQPLAADVWYRFTPTTAFPTITLSSIGSDFTTAGVMINIYSQSATAPCTGLASAACITGTTATLSLIPGGAGLTIGNSYLIRVSKNTNTVATTGTNWGFSICITEPQNDLCANAILLTSANACNNTAGTLTGSTYTTLTAPGCGITNRNDVWYKFIAQTTNPTITLSSAPANARIQLFSGSCTALASLTVVLHRMLQAA